jgi:hypothetical protein
VNWVVIHAAEVDRTLGGGAAIHLGPGDLDGWKAGGAPVDAAPVAAETPEASHADADGASDVQPEIPAGEQEEVGGR